MANINTRLGDSFERYFHKCLTVKGWNCVRIPDGCKQVSQFKIIRKKTPFDFFATKSLAKSFYCDAKTVDSDRFPYSKINQEQLKELLGIEKNGLRAGYVIFFRQADLYGFVSAGYLSTMISGESVKAWECFDLGRDIEIDRLFESA